LSIVGKGYHTDEQAVGYYTAGDRMKYWGKVGAFWGGFWGLLFGSALFMIPGLGPILAAGPVVAWIVAGLEGAVEVGALGALGAGLYSIGIPKDSIVKYETGTQDRSVPADRSRNGGRGSAGQGHHQNYASGRILIALRRSGSGSCLVSARVVWARLHRVLRVVEVRFDVDPQSPGRHSI
jgi:hypothetical protein